MKTKTDNNKKSIAAIAEECGVSAMTVSRALKNSPSVRKETKTLILDAAKKLGYHSPLKSGRPSTLDENARPTVDVVMGVFGKSVSIFYSELLTTIERELAERGYDCVIHTSNGEYNQFLSLRESLKSSTALATLIIGYFETEQLQALLESSPKAILLDNPGEPALTAPYSSFSFDNADAARIGARHLLENGRKNILLLKGEPEHYFSREIEIGYCEALELFQKNVNKNLVIETNFSAEDAYLKISAALESGLKFDAIFTNDEMACGAYRALQEKGIKIPEEVAVCGCDGLPIGEQLYPRLTTIKLDYKELGRMALEFLMKRRGENAPACRTKLSPTLEIRESSSN